MTPDRLRALRTRLGLSQAAFARRYGLLKRTIERWEQPSGYMSTNTPTVVLLTLIEREPELIAEIIARR